MELKQIQYFIELAKRQHISSTADQLQISQPALSKSLSSLEQELGVKLFDRQGKRIVLNRHGEQFLAHAQKAVESLSRGVASAQRMRYEVMGSVRIISSSSFSYIMPYIYSYMELNPHVRFRLDQYHLDKSEDEVKEADFIICTDDENVIPYLKSQFWTAEYLAEEGMGILVSANSPFCPPPGTESVNLQDFSEAPFVGYASKDSYHIDLYVRMCRSAGFFPKICCETEDFLIRLQLVERGLGICISTGVHLKMVQAAYPDIRYFPLKDQDRKVCFYLLHPRESVMTEVARDFWEFVRDDRKELIGR